MDTLEFNFFIWGTEKLFCNELILPKNLDAKKKVWMSPFQSIRKLNLSFYNIACDLIYLSLVLSLGRIWYAKL